MPHVLVFAKTFYFSLRLRELHLNGVRARFGNTLTLLIVLGWRKPLMERVVALLFYGYSDEKLSNRPLIDLSEHLKNYSG